MLGEEEETWEIDDTIDEQHRFERVEAMRCHHASE
jgi:hypothetical protein